MGGGGIDDDLDLVAQVAGQAGGGLHALLGADSGNAHTAYRAVGELLGEVGRGEGVVAGLGDRQVPLPDLQPGLQCDHAALRVEGPPAAGRGVQDPDDLIAPGTRVRDQALGSLDDVGR